MTYCAFLFITLLYNSCIHLLEDNDPLINYKCSFLIKGESLEKLIKLCKVLNPDFLTKQKIFYKVETNEITSQNKFFEISEQTTRNMFLINEDFTIIVSLPPPLLQAG